MKGIKGLLDLYQFCESEVNEYLDKYDEQYEWIQINGIGTYEAETAMSKGIYIEVENYDEDSEQGQIWNRFKFWREMAKIKGYGRYFSKYDSCVFVRINFDRATNGVHLMAYGDDSYINGDNELYDGMTTEEINKELHCCDTIHRRLIATFCHYVLNNKPLEDAVWAQQIGNDS